MKTDKLQNETLQSNQNETLLIVHKKPYNIIKKYYKKISTKE